MGCASQQNAHILLFSKPENFHSANEAKAVLLYLICCSQFFPTLSKSVLQQQKAETAAAKNRQKKDKRLFLE
jgi:hypothetical protein